MKDLDATSSIQGKRYNHPATPLFAEPQTDATGIVRWVDVCKETTPHLQIKNDEINCFNCMLKSIPQPKSKP